MAGGDMKITLFLEREHTYSKTELLFWICVNWNWAKPSSNASPSMHWDQLRAKQLSEESKEKRIPSTQHLNWSSLSRYPEFKFLFLTI